MTTPAEPDEQEFFAPSPVLVGGTVHIGHSIDGQAQAADFGAYMTYVTPAGADVARPVLPYDSKRPADPDRLDLRRQLRELGEGAGDSGVPGHVPVGGLAGR